MRGEILPRRNYWELAYIDISLVSTGELVVSRRPVFAQPFPQLERVIAEPKEKFDLTVSISGRFAAGGKPSEFRGYDQDFEARGFGEDLDAYANHLLNDLVSANMQPVAHYDAATGELTYY